VAQVVEANPAEPGAFEKRPKDALSEVIHLDGRTRLGGKDEIVREILAGIFETPLMAKRPKDPPQFPAHVDAPRSVSPNIWLLNNSC
jgi:hypothetical protein